MMYHPVSLADTILLLVHGQSREKGLPCQFKALNPIEMEKKPLISSMLHALYLMRGVHKVMVHDTSHVIRLWRSC